MAQKIIGLLLIGISVAYAYSITGQPDFNKLLSKNKATSQTSAKAIDILFVGNSYTFANDMPQILSDIAKASGIKQPINAYQVTFGGATLETHWNKKTALNTIMNGEWDYVVFQGQSTSMLWEGGVNSFDTHLSKFMNEIKKTKSQVILFSTWPRQEGSKDYQKLRTTYQEALKVIENNYYHFAKKYNTGIVYTGTPFYKANAQGINTYTSDGSHPNLIGSYLVAVAFIKAIYLNAMLSCPDIAKVVNITTNNCEDINRLF